MNILKSSELIQIDKMTAQPATISRLVKPPDTVHLQAALKPYFSLTPPFYAVFDSITGKCVGTGDCLVLYRFLSAALYFTLLYASHMHIWKNIWADEICT